MIIWKHFQPGRIDGAQVRLVLCEEADLGNVVDTGVPPPPPPPPPLPPRAEILRVHLRKASVAGDRDELVDHLVGMTDGFSGADLAYLCQSAKLHALQRGAFESEVALEAVDFDAGISEFAGRPDAGGPNCKGPLLKS